MLIYFRTEVVRGIDFSRRDFEVAALRGVHQYKFAEFKNFASNPLAKIILISTQATGRENLELAARRVRKSGRQADSGRENPTSNSENLPYFTPAWQDRHT